MSEHTEECRPVYVYSDILRRPGSGSDPIQEAREMTDYRLSPARIVTVGNAEILANKSTEMHHVVRWRVGELKAQ